MTEYLQLLTIFDGLNAKITNLETSLTERENELTALREMQLTESKRYKTLRALQQADKILLRDLREDHRLIALRLETSENLLKQAEESLNDSLRQHKAELIKTGVISFLCGAATSVTIYLILWTFDEWLRGLVKYQDKKEWPTAEEIREHLFEVFREYDYNPDG